MTHQDLAIEDTAWPADFAIFAVDTVEIRVSPEDHPLYLAHREAIAQNWESEKAAKPALYDGRMLLQRKVTLEDGVIRCQAHIVPFSAYLWWRRQAGVGGACHLFGMAVPVSRDGAIIAIRMSDHTANPGMVYCAAGSLDEHDMSDGICDIHSNMQREVLEETGLDLSTARADVNLYATRWGRFVSIFRFYHFDLTADEMLERIAEHMKTDPEQEIAGGVAIRSADPHAHPYNKAMAPILSMFFDRHG